MGLILDTSLLVAAERGTVRFRALLDTHAHEPVAMAAITASELLHGALRGRDAGARARRGAWVDALLAAIPVLPFGLAEARRHAHLWAELARDGQMVGPHDMQIAATALARGDRVGTLNVREFGRVAGLDLVDIGPFVEGTGS